jgi:hypothetical protein
VAAFNEALFVELRTIAILPQSAAEVAEFGLAAATGRLLV